MTSIPLIFSSVQNFHDLWQIAGKFPEMSFQIHKEGNTISAENDHFSLQAVFSEEKGVIIRRDTIHNHSDRPIVFHSILSRFQLDPGDYQVYTQLNCWEKESLGTWQKLVTGITAEAPGMRSCHSAVPMMAVWNEQTGRGIAYHLLAESAWKINIRQYWAGWRSTGVTLEMGIHDGDLHYELQPGETLTLPEIVFYPFRNQTDQDCYKLHNWFLSQNPSPVLPVVYNTWLYRFDWFKYDDIAAQVPVAADLGCEYFVIDAGWFGKEGNWGTSMGDYFERPAEAEYGFGGRMADMAELVRAHGMKFGLWMEIERANAASDAVKKYGDLFIPYHGEYFLDFRKPEAREYMLNRIAELIRHYGVEYLKFDCNGDMFTDDADGSFISYMRGYYHFIRELRSRHPDLYLLNCASGGMKMALSNARYFNSFWLSDNQNAYESLRILKDTLLRMPPQWIDRWLTLYSMPEFPYHYSEGLTQDMTFTTGDGTWSSAFSIDNSFIRGFTAGGPIGLSCDLTKLSSDTRDMLRNMVQAHKENRTFWQNCSVRILTDAGDILVLQYTDPAFDQAVICAFAENVRQNSIRVYPVLSQDAVYTSNLTEDSVTGKELGENGILLSFRERHTCVQCTFIKSEQI